MDEGCNKAVTEVFCKMHEKGWIYKGSRIVNWCPVCNTSISDAEVVYEEQAGHFLNWEHRGGKVRIVNKATPSPMTDLRILAALADALGSDLGFRNAKQAWDDLAELGAWDGDRPAAPVVAADGPADGLLLAGWRELLDASQGNDYEIALRATARPVVARVSTATAERLGLGEVVAVEAGERSALLPLDVVDGMVDDVIWVPLNPGTEQRLYAVPGTPVAVSPVSVDEGV